MPSYLYRRQVAPSAIKETLGDVKNRLQRELAQRTETRVKYWMRREEWCSNKPGRRIVIGWDTVIERHPFAHEGAGAELNVNEERLMGSTNLSRHASSCVETPD